MIEPGPMTFFEVGISGTRTVASGKQLGCTSVQLQRAIGIIAGWHAEHGAVRVHEGGCTGVDAELTKKLLAWRITWNAEKTMRICCHPPLKDTWREVTVVDEEMPPEEYLARNRRIVSHGRDAELILPKEYHYVRRGSGTWMVARHAVIRCRDTQLVFPDGTVKLGTSVPMEA